MNRKKAVPEVVAENMIEEQDGDDNYIFTRQEWLDPGQIKYLFAKFAREKKTKKSQHSEADVHEEMKDQILEHHFENVNTICNEISLDKPLDEQEHPKCIHSADGHIYNLCELAFEYQKARDAKRKMSASIFQYDFKPHFQSMLSAIGQSNFKGQSKVKAADKILAFIGEKCECFIL